ncbi:hypothetical protein [Christensenella massiliensis]|uniref:Uncharacterized protein n=1 Tax=Christensenella massiliensis TaxID=1805714 RepID=A0AAU8A6D2_9FIRM
MDWKEECEKWKQVAEERGKEIERLERSQKYDEEEHRAEIKKYYYGGLLGSLFATIFTLIVFGEKQYFSLKEDITRLIVSVFVMWIGFAIFFTLQNMSKKEHVKRNFWIIFAVMIGSYLYLSWVL